MYLRKNALLLQNAQIFTKNNTPENLYVQGKKWELKVSESLSRRTQICAECDQPFSNANNPERHFDRAHPGKICRPKGRNLLNFSVPSKRKHYVSEPVEENSVRINSDKKNEGDDGWLTYLWICDTSCEYDGCIKRIEIEKWYKIHNRNVWYDLLTQERFYRNCKLVKGGIMVSLARCIIQYSSSHRTSSVRHGHTANMHFF